MEKELNTKYCGKEVSEYGKKYNRVDYATFASMFDAVLCNNIASVDQDFYGNLESGSDMCYTDEDDNELTYDEYIEKFNAGEQVYENAVDVCQYYIVSGNALDYLKEAGEIVYYSDVLDCYIWGVTHFGTSWSYVLTSIKLNEELD